MIITILESTSPSSIANQNQTYEPYWLVETLLALKIPLINLFEIYHKIYKSRINYKSTGGITLDPINLLDILIYLINQLDNCHMNSIDRYVCCMLFFLWLIFFLNSIFFDQRQFFASKALDLISGYNNDLLLFSSLFDSTETRLVKIRNELNRTKIYLERNVVK